MRAVSDFSQRMGASSVVVGAGLSVTGLGTLVMMAMTARWLLPVDYQTFVTWWAVATFLGTGFFVFETYLARLVVRELSDELDPHGVVALMFGRAWLAVGVVCVLLLAAHSWLTTTLFRGNTAAAFWLVPFVIIAMLQCVQRGVATGHRYFIMNASQFATDGILRAGFVALAYFVTGSSVAHFCGATCASAATSVLVAHFVLPAWRTRPIWRGAEPWRPLGDLLMSITSVMLISNGAVVWLSGTHSVSATSLGAFAGAMTLSQIPTQLSSAVTSPALAHLAFAVERGEHQRFAHLHRLIISITLAVGIVFVVAFGIFGHYVLAIYIGPRYQLGHGFMFALAASSALMFLALVEQAVLGARHRFSAAAAMWATGSLTFAVSLFLPWSTIVRATLSTDSAVAVALIGMTLVNVRFAQRERGSVSDALAGTDP